METFQRVAQGGQILTVLGPRSRGGALDENRDLGHCTLDIVRWTLYVGHRTDLGYIS